MPVTGNISIAPLLSQHVQALPLLTNTCATPVTDRLKQWRGEDNQCVKPS